MHIMVHSSCTKNSVLIDLFNLPPLPDGKRQTSIFCKISNNFFLPDGKKFQAESSSQYLDFQQTYTRW